MAGNKQDKQMGQRGCQNTGNTANTTHSSCDFLTLITTLKYLSINHGEIIINVLVMSFRFF